MPRVGKQLARGFVHRRRRRRPLQRRRQRVAERRRAAAAHHRRVPEPSDGLRRAHQQARHHVQRIQP